MSPAGWWRIRAPRNAHKVSVAVAVVPCASERRLRSVTAKCDGLTKNRPANPTMASGTSLRTVVTTWTRPCAAMPRGVHRCQDPHRGDREDGRGGGLPYNRRNEGVEVADERDGQCGERAPHGNPVPPGDKKPREIAERQPRVRVGSAGHRTCACEAREHDGEKDRTAGGDDPSGKAGWRRRAQATRAAGRSPTDHVAHHDRDCVQKPTLRIANPVSGILIPDR
jgi:hypothetical protein